MKNKLNLTFLLSLTFFLCASGNAQTKSTSGTSKPNKEETMNWIAEKMKENLASPRKFISYSNGIFSFSKEMFDRGETTVCTGTIDLNKVTGMSNEYSSDFYISGKDFDKVTCTNGQGGTYEYLSISGPNYNKYGAPFNFTPDQSLVDRLKKAFANLIEYNSSKKGANEAY